MVDYVAKAIAARQINVSGTTLYMVAAQYLNDATQWYRIAELNGLTDPWIFGVVTLNLPTPSQTSNGGILGL